MLLLFNTIDTGKCHDEVCSHLTATDEEGNIEEMFLLFCIDTDKQSSNISQYHVSRSERVKRVYDQKYFERQCIQFTCTERHSNDRSNTNLYNLSHDTLICSVLDQVERNIYLRFS